MTASQLFFCPSCRISADIPSAPACGPAACPVCGTFCTMLYCVDCLAAGEQVSLRPSHVPGEFAICPRGHDRLYLSNPWARRFAKVPDFSGYEPPTDC